MRTFTTGIKVAENVAVKGRRRIRLGLKSNDRFSAVHKTVRVKNRKKKRYLLDISNVIVCLA